jgi:hypothetical protein
MKLLLTRIRNWYGRFERPVSSASLIGGFIFDALTLKRVDLFWENFWVLVHLIVVAGCIIIINLRENDEVEENEQARSHFWLINILQFTFGGLLSTFLVFYFRSATLSVTWPFIFILVLAFIANESLKKHYERLVFQISLFYLSILSFAIFIVPVFFHRIGSDVFLLSGLASLLVLWLFILILKFFAKEKFLRSKKILTISVSSIFLLINILYFFNLIPPIPLSLKDAGIFHSISRNTSGNYIVQSEDTGWRRYFTLHDTFHKAPGEPVYFYSAIFSPTSFYTGIIHEWQKYDPNKKDWIATNRISLSVSGGREGGFRTYSIKGDISPGEWRVNVETEGGQIIGRYRFDVEQVSSEPALKTIIK